MKVLKHFCFLAIWMGAMCCFSSTLAQDKNPVIAFASDTQAPLAIEKVIRRSDHNTKATELIFKDVIATHPAGLFILGDVVSLGYKNSKWQAMDSYLKLCSQNNIPVYASLGNHELMLNAAKGAERFQSRFPMHKSTGYVEVIDSVAIVLLNSNFSKMKDSAIARQDAWYIQTITGLDNDAAIKLVIIGCHHSPFTNSKVVKPSSAVQQKFVPAFINSKKCVLFLSGHSHNFERFNFKGKDFLVIGGGGGPHQPLRSDKITPDMAADYKPMFHYLQVKRNHDSLQVVSRRLNTDFSGFANGLTFYSHKH